MTGMPRTASSFPRKLSLSLLAAAALAPAVVFAAEAAEDFVPLWNGKDLTGWVNVNGAPETWTVVDGLLHCDGSPVCALRTEKQYENFIFEAEWRHLTSGGNAGIFIWASALPAPGQPFLRAIEVQVLDHGYGTSDWFTTHGDVFAIHGATMEPFPPSKGMRSFPRENRGKGFPEWNHYRVTCTDGKLHLAVNGKNVSGGENCVWRKGYIGLESEGAPVDWRNVRIKELPGGKATPEQTAPLAPSAKNLYDGRTLRGWTAPETGGWKAEGWTLASAADAKPITLEEKIGEGAITFDVRSQEETVGDVSVKLGDTALTGMLKGGWTRLTLTRTGETATLSSPDGALATAAVGKEPLTFSLTPDRPTTYANLFLLDGKKPE